tara:strand:- start:6134 stop:6691 length:558 start_codon:yes stop_codon:yes gene_type:complete
VRKLILSYLEGKVMNDVKDFGKYTVKNVKSFMGREGYGFNCSLYRDGKKVGSCIDDAGGGGMYPIDWDMKIDRKHEQTLFDAHIKSLPAVASSFGKKDMTLTIDEGWFVTELVNKWEQGKEVRKVKRKCAQKTLYRTLDQNDGSYFVSNILFSPEVGRKLRAKYGDKIEIFNEVFEKGSIPSVLS